VEVEMTDCDKCKCQYVYDVWSDGECVFACTAAEVDDDASEFWDSEEKPEWDCPCYVEKSE
jgi:hypothetical protein